MMDTQQFSVFFVGSADEVREHVNKDKLGGLIVPAAFDDDIKAGKTPDLQVYTNARRGGLRQMAFKQIVEAGVRSVAGQTMPVNVMVTEVSNVGAGAGSPFDLTSYYLNLFLVLSLTMVGVFVVPYILVEEKEKQTLKAVLVSPASYVDVVMGKGLVGLIYALVVAVVLMALNKGFVGNVLVTSLALLLGAVFLVQLGLLMGAMFKTVNQVNSWSSIVMLALLLPGMFSDAFLPPPEPLPTILGFIPTSYMANAITQGMANSATASSAALNLGVLAVSAVVAFVAVIWFLRRERA
jgi:ABC-2 type transport system permease protein